MISGHFGMKIQYSRIDIRLNVKQHNVRTYTNVKDQNSYQVKLHLL